MTQVVEVYNNQSSVEIEDSLLEKLQSLAQAALPQVLKNPANGGGVMEQLELIEVSIVDDEIIAQVHLDFMDIPGATDVITFAHGEIVISVETAIALSAEYKHSWQRELMLYIIHGLLHLCGHEDTDPKERAKMEKLQFAILDKVWV